MEATIEINKVGPEVRILLTKRQGTVDLSRKRALPGVPAPPSRLEYPPCELSCAGFWRREGERVRAERLGLEHTPPNQGVVGGVGI